ncbi:hypothetical protein F4802DRAFT_218980 [Xylaria palmicola]|nr:hypothetical protein F4802DRAFT_218980 [Xylaria palmicola]
MLRCLAFSHHEFRLDYRRSLSPHRFEYALSGQVFLFQLPIIHAILGFHHTCIFCFATVFFPSLFPGAPFIINTARSGAKEATMD